MDANKNKLRNAVSNAKSELFNWRYFYSQGIITEKELQGKVGHYKAIVEAGERALAAMEENHEDKVALLSKEDKAIVFSWSDEEAISVIFPDGKKVYTYVREHAEQLWNKWTSDYGYKREV